ncbi:DnaA regulatory inactivator Hda [Neiella marina]|uniref:DnaA regulatory inactivator Hda n=1 Tax=Neiella marina TaxID=508461 RepID=A0A8J2U6C9_9GAMM|nr:DnaA inactivator Hda [Neiella marina]GGA82163.1 DnaA regulatory inactivator Hda [Neiella marina]
MVLTIDNSGQLPLAIQLPDDETFASFYSAGNEVLVAAMKQALNSDSGGFLYLWGPASSGKSHLLHAALNWCASCHQPSSYIPLQHHASMAPEMLEGLENLHLVVLDNLNEIAGHEAWEQAIFDLFNRVKEQGKVLIVSADAAARHLQLQLPDLTSRLDWGASYQLAAPDDDSKLAILQLRANMRGLVLSDEAGRFLLHRASRNMADLWLTLNKLDTASMQAQRKLTVPFIKQVLGY